MRLLHVKNTIEDRLMEGQRFLFLFEFLGETYALMWDVENRFVFLVRQSDGKTTDGFTVSGYKNFIDIKGYKDSVVANCKFLLGKGNYFNFQ